MKTKTILRIIFFKDLTCSTVKLFKCNTQTEGSVQSFMCICHYSYLRVQMEVKLSVSSVRTTVYLIYSQFSLVLSLSRPISCNQLTSVAFIIISTSQWHCSCQTLLISPAVISVPTAPPISTTTTITFQAITSGQLHRDHYLTEEEGLTVWQLLYLEVAARVPLV